MSLLGGTAKGELDDTVERPLSKWMYLFGHFVVLLMALTWTISASCSQALGGYVPKFELNLWRFVFLCFCSLPLLIYRGTSPAVERKKMGFICIHGLMTAVYNLTFYEASIYLPTGSLAGLESTFMLVIGAPVSFCLKRTLSKTVVVSCLVSLMGLLFLLQPEFLFKYIVSNHAIPIRPVCHTPLQSTANYTNISTFLPPNTPGHHVFNTSAVADSNLGVLQNYTPKGFLLILISSTAYVTSLNIVSRYLYDVDVFVVQLWCSLIGMGSSVIMMAATEKPNFPTSPLCISLLLIHSFSGGLSSLLGVKGVQLLSPLTYTLLSNLQLVFFLVAQYTVLKNVNPGYHNWLEVTGVIFVFVGGIFDPVYTFCKGNGQT